MNKSHQLGRQGEALALEFLKHNDLSIIDSNWRWQKAEIDIIAKSQDILIFIEVKTRSSEKYGSPHEFVSEKKQTLMKEAAEAYLELHDLALEIRFDIISIILTKNKRKIKHISDAF